MLSSKDLVELITTNFKAKDDNITILNDLLSAKDSTIHHQIDSIQSLTDEVILKEKDIIFI